LTVSRTLELCEIYPDVLNFKRHLTKLSKRYQ